MSEDSHNRSRLWIAMPNLMRHLSSYGLPQVAGWRFWLSQFGVIAIFVAQEVARHATYQSGSKIPLFVISALYLIPVLYSALKLGFYSTVITAGVATIVLSFVVSQQLISGDTVDVWADNVQIVIIDLVGCIVGHYVETTKKARSEAEQEGQAHRMAEDKYRDLFQRTSVPIAIATNDGELDEINDEFVVMSGMSREELLGRPLGSTIDRDAAQSIMRGDQVVTRTSPSSPYLDVDLPSIQIQNNRSEPKTYRASGNRLDGPDGLSRVQIVFEDITTETIQERQAKDLALSVIQGQEAERLRIARELHDVPVQSLVQLCRILDRLLPGSNAIASGGGGNAEWPLAAGPQTADSETEGLLAEARKLAEGIIGDLREIAKGLRPVVLEDLGLVASIGRLVSDFQDRSGVNVQFRVSGEEAELDTKQDLVVYRISQECLNNVDLHAGATNVIVKLEFDSDHLKLVIEDDGNGLQGAFRKADGHEGLGLIGMRERADSIGAELTIESGISGDEERGCYGVGAGVKVQLVVAIDHSSE